MRARSRSAAVVCMWAALFLLTAVTPFGGGTVAAASQSACVALPDAVPASAAARTRNPRICPPPPPPVTSYTLRTTDAQSSDPDWKTSYAANDTYDVWFALDVSGPVAGSHTYSLFVFMPNGFAYEAFEVTYSATGCSITCSVDQTADGIRVWISMPVAGTMIQQFQLYGVWTAEAWIDAATSPTAVTEFEITG